MPKSFFISGLFIAMLGALSGTAIFAGAGALVALGAIIAAMIGGKALPELPVVSPAAPSEFECPDCGYDLRGINGAVCPECGARKEEPE